MARIHKLPERVANQIAAGEVVERPVAVVKELVENSIDAGATRIDISFRNGGKQWIRISDNGDGMDPEDARLAVQRHATSKIREANDLLTIQSLGFRGEALPSIASVSKFSLRSRTQNQAQGIELLISGGHEPVEKECGMPEGTTIEVAQLFHTVPARRKFLKADKTEAGHIIQLCRLLAIAHPEIAFHLQEDTRSVFKTPICPNLKERIIEVYGKKIFNTLIPLDITTPQLDLTGYMARPGIGKSTRQDMVTFVNKRPVDSRTLNYAIIDAYSSYMPKGRYPQCFLFLKTDPSNFDINVHPAKKEIRFKHEANIRRIVIESLISELDRFSAESYAATVATTECCPPANQPGSRHKASPTFQQLDHSTTQPTNQPRSRHKASPTTQPLNDSTNHPTPSQSKAAELLRKRSLTANQPGSRHKASPTQPLNNSTTQPLNHPTTQQLNHSTTQPLNWKFLGFHKEKYALLESANGLILLSLRAAQYRILFDNYLEESKRHQISSQDLLIPPEIEIDPIDDENLKAELPWLAKNGFHLKESGKNRLQLISIPSFINPSQAEALVQDLIGWVRERQGSLNESQHSGIRDLARKVVKRSLTGNRLKTPQEALALASNLMHCKSPMSDPEGKPTLKEITQAEISRWLGEKL